jgi:hypothetical protein
MTVQYAKAADTSKVRSKEDKTYIQQVIGTLLYYGRAVDATIFVAFSSLASAQATLTDDTMLRTHHLLDYVATHPDAILSYAKSDMILGIHSDASYLSEPKARPFFPIRRHQRSTQQRRHSQYIPNHQIRHVLGSRSQTWRALHQHM